MVFTRIFHHEMQKKIENKNKDIPLQNAKLSPETALGRV